MKLDGVTMSDDPAAVFAVNRLTREAYLQAADAADRAGNAADAAKFRSLAVSLLTPDAASMGAASASETERLKAERIKNLQQNTGSPEIKVTPVKGAVIAKEPSMFTSGIRLRSNPPFKADFFWALKDQPSPPPSVKEVLYGSRKSGLRALGSANHPSLGYPPDAQIESQILSLLASSPTPYDAFVQFTLANAPGGIWTLDAYQVNEALRSFERNYSLYQDAKDAAAWGLRFPDDMRADIAFKRMKLAATEWDNLFLGFYVPLSGSLQTDASAAEAKNLVYQLGSDPTFFYTEGYNSYLTLSYVFPTITTVQTLHAPNADGGYPSESLEIWYSHVYRSLQYFVPVMAKFLTAAGSPAIDTINLLAIPNLENSPRFVSWVVASSFFMFFRFNADKELRGMADDHQLADFIEGTNLAFAKNTIEVKLYQLIGQSIAKQIEGLELIERLLKLAKMPLDIIIGAGGKALDLAKALSLWEWILIALGGVAAVTATAVVVRKVL